MGQPLKNLLRIFVLALSLMVDSAIVHAESVRVNIGVGQTYDLELEEFAKSVRISKNHVVQAKRGANKKIIQLTGLKAGSVLLKIKLESGKTTDYNISVTDAAAHARRLTTLRENLQSLPGLSAQIVSGKVAVTGRVLSRSTLQTLSGLKSQNPGLIVDGTDKKLPESNTVIDTINRVLQENDIANLQAFSYGKIIALEGSPKTKKEAELALRIARMIAPDVEDRITLDQSAASSVSIDVMFVEVEAKNNKSFGLNGQITSDGKNQKDAIASGSVSGAAGSRGRLNWKVGDLKAFLHMLQSKSASRVLSNPKLVARSGEEATFHSGGTLYVSVSSVKDGATIASLLPINYGIELGILPKIDRLGQIDTKINTSVSELGDQQSESAPPNLITSKVSTSVTIKDGQSILLSGLVNKKERKVVERVPLLADIPIVGELFKSRKIDEEEVELLVLVTINRVRGTSEKSALATELWQSAEKDVEFSFFD